MRILRSQYLKYRTGQVNDARRVKTKTKVQQFRNDAEVQHSHTYFTRSSTRKNEGVKSVETVMTKSHTTTVRSKSIVPYQSEGKTQTAKTTTTKSQTTLYHRRNSNTSLTSTSDFTNDVAEETEPQTPIYIRRNSNTIYGNNSTLNTLSPITNDTAVAIERDKNNTKWINVVATPPPQSIQQRRQTVAGIPDELINHQIQNALKIKLLNAPYKRFSRINVVVKFYDEGPAWYTRFYRSYEQVLWQKLPRENVTNKRRKWHYKCVVCKKMLCSFTTLKSHLNIHMKFFPYRCDLCPKQYPAKQSYNRHKKSKHIDQNE